MPPPDATNQQVEDAADERARVEQWLARERVFQVTTTDGLNWIDPFTGDVLAAPFGFREAALEHLLRTRPWRAGRKPLPLPNLVALRWMKLLRERINAEPRLKIFDRDGLWLNPFTGDWEPTVKLGGKLTVEILQAMAQALARTIGLRTADLMPAPELERVARAASRRNRRPRRPTCCATTRRGRPPRRRARASRPSPPRPSRGRRPRARPRPRRATPSPSPPPRWCARAR